MPNSPFWQWCPQAGMQRSTKLKLDQVDFGDGYVHRITRGINPVVPSWSISVPFTSVAELKERDDFLRANAVNGFWMLPADDTVEVYVYADDWQATITDRNGGGDMVGTLQVTVTRCFNPQPVT